MKNQIHIHVHTKDAPEIGGAELMKIQRLAGQLPRRFATNFDQSVHKSILKELASVASSLADRL